MPSGAKKRKAAKKKKEIQPNDHPNPSVSTHSHGSDDVKHQDGKESDVGEVSSPASQDHHSQQSHLTEGEEEETERASNFLSVEGSKTEVSLKRNVEVEGTSFPVEREFKIEDESGFKDERHEHDEAGRKSYDGGSSGSSSSGSGSGSGSSSDDESHDTMSGQAVVDISPIGDSVKVADTFSEEHLEAIERSTIEGANVSIMESLPNENADKKQSCTEDQVVFSEATTDATSQREEAVIPSVENDAQETDDSLNLSYNAPVTTVDNGGDAQKDSGVTEPLLVPASHHVQMTSWKGCCGLFEVFTGSGR